MAKTRMAEWGVSRRERCHISHVHQPGKRCSYMGIFTCDRWVYFLLSSDTARWPDSHVRCGSHTGDEIQVPCSVHDATEPCLLPQCNPLQGSTWQPVNQFCASLALQPTSPSSHSQLRPTLLFVRTSCLNWDHHTNSRVIEDDKC